MLFKKAFLIVYILILSGNDLLGQIPASSLKIYPIRNVSWKQVDSLSLQIIESTLNNNNILVLAEQNHGDGSSYDAQCMLLKGLIDSEKIQSIYIESSWLNCEKIMSLLRDSGRTAIQ